MFQRVYDAGAKVARDLIDHGPTQVAPNRIAAEWEGKAGFLEPPGAEVGPELQPTVAVSKLPLVDQQAGIYLAPKHRVLDLIEGEHDLDEIRLIQLETE